MDEILRSLYYDVNSPAGYSSVQKLYAEASVIMPSLTLKDVDDWLRGETTYTLHRQARRNFKRNPIVSHSIGEWCQADLVDMQSLAGRNGGNKYLLTFIDVFSKRATAVPLKSKSMTAVAKALVKVFDEFVCFNLLTDRGLEFKNSAVEEVMEKYGVRLRFSYNEAIKASVAERFNRTLKSRMHRYFTARGTRRYIDVLDSLLRSYNHSVHRSIGMRPVDVTPENSSQVFSKLYGVINERELLVKQPERDPSFRIGDIVRMKYYLQPMEKSYFPLFTDQTFTVVLVFRDYPRCTYRLRNWAGEILDRKFYDEDLLKVSENTEYRIDRVIKRRGNESFVKWTGYPENASSWVRNVSTLRRSF